MDRKDFLRSMGLACGCMFFCGGGLGAAVQEGDAGDARQKFFERWITSLMNNLEAQLDEDQLRALMEACGKDCFESGPGVQMAKSCEGDIDKAVALWAGYVGKENCYMEGNEVHIKLHGRCYCPLVGEGPDTLPRSYCICSEGYVREFFSTVTQQPVEVVTLQAVKWGDPCCEFVAKIQA